MIDAKQMTTLLDALLEGLQVLSPEWRYLHVSDAAAQHGRSTKQALIGRSMLECYPGIEKTAVFELMQRCMVERTSHVLENEFTFPDGSSGSYELRIEPVPQGICVLSIDVTARKEAEVARNLAEKRLHHTQRLEGIGRLAASIAHDFNNHLTVIMGQAHAALLRADGPRREDLETMLVAAQSAAGLTRQLLAYGRPSVTPAEPLHLPSVLQNLDRVLRLGLDSRVELVIHALPAVGMVSVPRAELEQVVMNLVWNARDAVVGGGQISITVNQVDIGPEFASTRPGARLGPHVVLEVVDTGIGMAAATSARIFEPFFTTKGGSGTGLGLATVHDIVRRHEGVVLVQSEQGVGTSFKVYLPSVGPLGLIGRPGSPTAARFSTKPSTILFVDDMPQIGKVITRFLEADSHRVLLATSGRGGLALWRENRQDVDLLVTDLGMPGLSGSELITQVRAERPGLPVICMSGGDNAYVRNLGAVPKDVAFLEKPFAPRQLLERVHELLAARTT